MTAIPAFRCPFEVQGEQEGTIRRVALNTNRTERLASIRRAFEEFWSHPERPAVRFCLDPALWSECTTIRALKNALVPYQAEILGGELDVRLAPFLPHQIGEVSREESARTHRKDPLRLSVASALAHTINEQGGDPASVAGIADWIEGRIRTAKKDTRHEPHLQIYGPLLIGDMQAVVHLLTITVASITVPLDRLWASDPNSNRNTFSIVKAPLYKPTFGRYSECVEIVVSRESDFARLSEETRRQIRTLSNRVLGRGGVKIVDEAQDRQEIGVWVPRMRA